MPKNTDNWAALLQAELKNRARKPEGKGWLTFERVVTKWNLSAGRTHGVLRDLVIAGKVETFTGCDYSGKNKLTRKVWYRIK